MKLWFWSNSRHSTLPTDADGRGCSLGDKPGHDGGGDGRLRSSSIPNWATGGQNPARLARDLPDLALPALALPAFALPPALPDGDLPIPGLLPRA